jgi:hypothetical protein
MAVTKVLRDQIVLIHVQKIANSLIEMGKTLAMLRPGNVILSVIMVTLDLIARSNAQRIVYFLQKMKQGHVILRLVIVYMVVIMGLREETAQLDVQRTVRPMTEV